MAQLSLGDLKLGFADFFADKKKQKLFEATNTAKVYLPLLKDQRGAIDSLPPAITQEGRPLADQLAAEDLSHDSYGLAIWHLNEAYRVVPGLDPALRKITGVVTQKVIGRPGDVRNAYPKEAEKAAERNRALPKIKADLAKFPVVGGTLADWVASYTAHGEAIGKLLSARGAKAAESAGGDVDKAPIQIRTETIGLLGRTRATLADEVKRNAKLPRNLDAQLFGYFDTLLASRAARETKAPASVPVTTGDPGAATPVAPKPRTKARKARTRSR